MSCHRMNGSSGSDAKWTGQAESPRGRKTLVMNEDEEYYCVTRKTDKSRACVPQKLVVKNPWTKRPHEKLRDVLK